MSDSSRSVLPASLAQAQQRFELWRSKQSKRSRLPEDLWSLAVDLARQFGIGRTAKALRLDHTKLKDKCQNTQTLASESMGFLELRPPGGPVECCVEVQRSEDLQTLRLTLTGPDWPDLGELFQEFWRS